MDPAAIAQIAQMGLDLLAFKHYYHAATTILLYDHILTFGDEVELIWKRKKTLISYLFIFVRYFTLATTAGIYLGHELTSLAMVESLCDSLVVIQVVQTTFVELVAQVVMTLRVYALSQRNRCILGALSVHVVTQFGLGLYLSVNSRHALELPKIPVEVFYSCFIKPDPLTAKLAYIFLLLAFDSITFLATVYYTATQYRFVARHGIPRLSKLFTSIVEGAAMYFGVLAVCHAVLVAGILTWRPTLKFLPACPTVLFTCILINRMTISTLKANREDIKLPPNHRPTVSLVGANNSQRSNPHARQIPGYSSESADLATVTHGGVVPTILSSVHVYA